MARPAVDGIDVVAIAEVAPADRGDGRAVAQRADVGDQLADLDRPERRLLPDRLGVGLIERHPAGGEIEVGPGFTRSADVRPLVGAFTAEPVARAAMRL